MLGPVGGRIVAEVLIGLLQGDSMSQRRQDPDWTPVFGQGPRFTMSDLLRFAVVAQGPGDRELSRETELVTALLPP